MSITTYIPIQSYTLVSNSPSVTFLNISQNYKDIILVSQPSFVSNGVNYVTYQVGNGTVDTGTNYSYTYFDMYSGTTGTGRATGVTYGLYSYSSSAGLTTSQTQPGTMHFMNYSSNETYKTTLSRNMSAADMTTMYVNLWRSFSPINIITLTGNVNFAIGSTFTLYGIA